MFFSSKLCGFDVHYLKVHNTFPPYHQSPKTCFGSDISRDWVHSFSSSVRFFLQNNLSGYPKAPFLRYMSPFSPLFSSPPHAPVSTLCRQLLLEHSVQGLFVEILMEYPITYFSELGISKPAFNLCFSTDTLAELKMPLMGRGRTVLFLILGKTGYLCS